MFLTSSLYLPKHLIGFPFLDLAYWQVCWNSPSLIHLDFFGLNFKRTYGTLPPKADRIHPACIWVIYDYISCCCEVIHEGPYWWLIDPWLNPWPSCLPFGRSGQYPHSHYKQDIGELEIVHPVVTMGWNRQQWPGSVFIRNNSWQSPAHLQVHGIALLLTRSACWGHIFRRWLGPFCCKILFSIMSWISTLVCSMHPENTAMSAFCMNVSIYQLC